MIVIDTHALVWMIEADPKLGRRARDIIENERTGDGVAIAPISVWEAAMLWDKSKIGLSRPVEHWFTGVLETPGYHLAQMTVAIGADAGSLPDGIHGDPADRLIIATARALGCPLLTADHKILAYPSPATSKRLTPVADRGRSAQAAMHVP